MYGRMVIILKNIRERCVMLMKKLDIYWAFWNEINFNQFLLNTDYTIIG